MTELHFYAYICNNYHIINIYLWEEESGYWMWDSGKYSIEEALNKYPLNKYKWVSITDED